jgi:hypothetical protein
MPADVLSGRAVNRALLARQHCWRVSRARPWT